MEFNAEQIKKALECCQKGTASMCEKCPCCNILLADNEVCSERLAKYALSLINELTEENERLQDESDRYKRYYFNHEYDKFEAEVRADTVRKMQELFEERLDISVDGYSTDEVVGTVLDTLERVAEKNLEDGK